MFEHSQKMSEECCHVAAPTISKTISIIPSSYSPLIRIITTWESDNYMFSGHAYYKNIANSEITAYNGNRSNGKKFITWNKGRANLDNKMAAVSQIIKDHKPDVLTLTEAQIHQTTDLNMIQIEGYKLFTDSLYKMDLQVEPVHMYMRILQL